MNACRECPFRKNSAPGWLGAAAGAESFLDQTGPRHNRNEVLIPCHMEVDWESEDAWIEAEGANRCRGQLHVMANCGKLPRDPEAAAMVKEAGKSEECFANLDEFVTHHDGD